MVKACSKFGARRASERDTPLKEVMVRQLTKESVKKKEQKKPLDKKNKSATLFCDDGHTLTRTSDPSQMEPRLDLWTTCSPGHALSFKYTMSYISTSQKSFACCWHKRVFLGITGGITVLRG